MCLSTTHGYCPVPVRGRGTRVGPHVPSVSTRLARRRAYPGPWNDVGGAGTPTKPQTSEVVPSCRPLPGGCPRLCYDVDAPVVTGPTPPLPGAHRSPGDDASPVGSHLRHHTTPPFCLPPPSPHSLLVPVGAESTGPGPTVPPRLRLFLAPKVTRAPNANRFSVPSSGSRTPSPFRVWGLPSRGGRSSLAGPPRTSRVPSVGVGAHPRAAG